MNLCLTGGSADFSADVFSSGNSFISVCQLQAEAHLINVFALKDFRP